MPVERTPRLRRFRVRNRVPRRRREAMMCYRTISMTAAAVAVMASTWFGTPALAESRLALVIGNAAYQSVSPLINPANDAKAMTDLLTAAGFEVTAAPDLTQEAM